jgi:acyl-CoA thioester hydrolase
VKKHRTPIQIRFKDVDALGHVNNANHLTYFETARIDYFRAVISVPIDWETEGMILKHQSVDYKKPILLNDQIAVDTWFVRAGNTSFELHYSLVRINKDGSETEMASGTSIIVCYNYKEQRTTPVPKIWVEKMGL